MLHLWGNVQMHLQADTKTCQSLSSRMTTIALDLPILNCIVV